MMKNPIIISTISNINNKIYLKFKQKLNISIIDNNNEIY